MVSQPTSTVMNSFNKGLITEATGLNFPENAATATSNCVYSLTGDVLRRQGIDFETNGMVTVGFESGVATNSYVWNNPGGDGNSKLLVRQVGNLLYFWNIATATVASPLSTKELAQSIDLSLYISPNGSFDRSKECSFADGNGYLIVVQSSINPVYITYDPVTLALTTNIISVNIRDFVGSYEPQFQNINVNVRPPLPLTVEHFYNLQNQGWLFGNPWSSSSTTSMPWGTTGSFTFTIATGLSGPTAGQSIGVYYTGAPVFLPGYGYVGPGAQAAWGTVTGYVSGTGALTINITSVIVLPDGLSANSWNLVPGLGPINAFQAAASVFPSNADVWWYFKDSTGAFNPSTTLNNVTLALGNAPQGHFVLSAFNQNRNISGVTGLTPVTTTQRPSSVAWYAGRAWYSGVNASQDAAPVGDTTFYTWTENIYFSQVSVNNPTVLGNCYQNNDPTSETLFDILPTDGGVITIYGSGTIHKLWPVANGLLVFANNGVWFITGSQGIGFAANDYTITKISSVKVLSSRSFVDVLGLPYFWNEEGIYQVSPSQSGSLTVEPLTVGTILTYYQNIPLASKKYARGDYDPINYIIQWCYRSTQETSVSTRYQFDTILNFNTYTRAFYPYNIPTDQGMTTYIQDVKYISYPFISNATPEPGFKYQTQTNTNTIIGVTSIGFADEHDTTYVDWASLGGVNYKSTFTTGYGVHGQAWRKFQAPYVYVYSRNNGYAAYYIQGCWDYGDNFDSNRWSMPQFTEINDSNSSTFIRRHKIRGMGYVLQLQFTSVDGQPFDIIGWALYENINQGA